MTYQCHHPEIVDPREVLQQRPLAPVLTVILLLLRDREEQQVTRQ